MSDLPYVYNEDRARTAINRIYSQFRHKERFQAVLSGLAAGGFQVFEDMALEVLTGTTLELAGGRSLDQWADLVGQSRGDLTDDELRGFVKARVIANIGQGTIDEALLLAQHTMQPLALWYRPKPPAGFRVYVLRSEFVRDTVRAEVGRLFEAAIAAGIDYRLIEVLVGYHGVQDPSGLAPAEFTTFGPRGFGIGRLAREV